MKRLLKKAYKDLFTDTKKNVLTFLAIIIGLVAFGTMLFSYEMMVNELTTTYSAINPSSAVISVDKVDEDFIKLTEEDKNIMAFEVKSYYKLRGQKANGEWVDVELFMAQDYQTILMNKVFFIDGKTNPNIEEALIERDAMFVADKGIDESVTFQLPDGTEKSLKITGVVNDLSVHPATMHNTIYMYVSPETLEKLGLVANRIDIQIDGNPFDRERILSISNEYMKVLEDNGYQIKSLLVEDTPGVSMHLDEYKTTLFLLRSFAFIFFIFTCLIMSNLLAVLLSKQNKQIGILKAIGIKSRYILSAYLLVLFIIIIGCMIVSFPIAQLSATMISRPLLRISNMTLTNTSISLVLYSIFLLLGSLVPLCITYPIIRKGTKISIKEAISDNQSIKGENNISNEKKFKNINTKKTLTMRNAIRKKGRFITNVITLVVSGVSFIAILVSMLSVDSTLNDNMNTFKYDYRLSTTSNNLKQLDETLKTVAAVDQYEVWNMASGKMLNTANEINGNYTVIAIPEDSEFANPTIFEGTWNNKAALNNVVVSHEFINNNEELKLGDHFNLVVAGIKKEFIITGVIQDFSGAFIYMNQADFARYLPEALGQNVVNITINSETRGKKRKALISEIEKQILNDNISILQSNTKADAIKILKGHYMTTFQTLLILALMILLISAFGLATINSIQALERTKEIGIMKAVGASNKQIHKIITNESMFICIFSWFITILFSIPAIIGANYYFSNTLIETRITINIPVILISWIAWFILTLIIARKTSKKAAKHAIKLTIIQSFLLD